ncbi:MAG: NAD(P)/FAD-dependent oxidoreductase, partial [Acidimicrobiales bacterium]
MARIVIVGGGAAGLGAAGAAKQVDPGSEVVVFTEFEDVAYSPCGIPYVHGREIESFEPLFLQGREFYAKAGIDVRYETRVSSVDLANRRVAIEGGGSERFDRLVLGTGFNYADPGVPGGGLDGLYYVK